MKALPRDSRIRRLLVANTLGDNGRLTFMFCVFTGDSLILSGYGRERSVRPRDPLPTGIIDP